MNAFSGEGYTFNKNQQAVIGIKHSGSPDPDPELIVDPATLIFDGCFVGEKIGRAHV